MVDDGLVVDCGRCVLSWFPSWLLRCFLKIFGKFEFNRIIGLRNSVLSIPGIG